MWKALLKDCVVSEGNTFEHSIARIRHMIELQFFAAWNAC